MCALTNAKPKIRLGDGRANLLWFSHLTSHLSVLSCDVLNVYIPATADRYGSGLTGVSQPSLVNR